MASNIKGITIEIGGDTTKLDKALTGVNKSSRSLQSELKQVDRLLKLDPKNTELLAQKQTLLKQSISETGTKLNVLKEAEKQVQEQFKKGEVSEEQYRALQREIIKTQTELKTLEDEATKNNISLEKVGTAIETVGKKTEQVGKKLLPVTAGIAAVGTASIAAFNDVDQGYDTIITKTGATGSALEGLQTSMDNLFANLPIEAEAAGIAIGEVNTRFGATGKSLEDLSTKFIQFAEINETDLNASIGTTSKIMKQWNIETSKTGDLLGLITKKSQDTGISVDTLMLSVQENGAIFKEMGLDIGNSITLLAEFEKNGVNAETAMAGLKKSVQNYTAQGKSTDEALKLTIDSIKNAKNETEAMTIASEIFGKKGAAEMSTAIREGRIDIENLSTSLSDYSNVVSDTFNATLDPPDQAKIALNNLKLAGSELGATLLNSLSPIISKVVDKVKTFATWFKKLSQSQQQTIIMVGALVAAIGPALIILGKVAVGISAIISTIAKVKTAVIGAKAAFAAFNTVIAANPIVFIVAAIVAVIAAIVLLYTKCEWFRNAVNEIITAIIAFFVGLWKKIVEIFGNIGPWFKEKFQQAYNGIISVFSAIGGWFASRWADITGAFAAVGTWFTTMFKTAYNGIVSVFSAIGGWFGARWADITKVFSVVSGWFSTQFTAAWEGIKNAFSNVGQFFSDLWNTIVSCFVNVGTAIGDAVGGAFKSAINAVLSTIENIVNGFIRMINGVINVINMIPGVDLGKIGEVNIPKLAKGGVLRNGQAIMAEAGPELITMVNGNAIVTPLTKSARNTAMNQAGLGSNSSGSGGFTQNNYYTSPKALNPSECARLTRNETRNMVLRMQRA